MEKFDCEMLIKGTLVYLKIVRVAKKTPHYGRTVKKW